ncbi:hypothetical protein [Cellulomonas sp.]|uniref:hypothetical protein n=1 Tax=Cellulomonas sp. TaxID=40001 RepID=UPI001B04CBBF|nr:hypothetical protein [Cellulomonas sp.]MBO9556322.1 hypothetical protein [Cellulomonas sp.]
MRSARLRRSVPSFVWGVVLLVGGAATWRAAREADARSAVLDPSFGGDPGRPWLVIGGFLVLAGLALLAVGVVRLTKNEDDLPAAEPEDVPDGT